MTRTRTIVWIALALGSSLPIPAAAQQSYQPPTPGGEIQLYSRPLEEKPAASALPESPRPISEVEPRPIPKVRYEDLPPERPVAVPDPPPIPKLRYKDLSQPVPESPPQGPAEDEDAAGSDWPPPGERLDIQEDRGIRYVSGGIGEGERVELNGLSSQFNLRLLFAMQSSGSYVADVQVRVLDARGELALTAESKGPWFFAKLPPGTYTVEAEALGKGQRQTARVGGANQTRLNFYWH